jgi:putative hydrolase
MKIRCTGSAIRQAVTNCDCIVTDRWARTEPAFRRGWAGGPWTPHPDPLSHDIGRTTLIDQQSDLHTHSNLSDGTDSPEEMANAATRAGLRIWGLSEHVRANSTWIPEYVTRVRALRRDEVDVRCGVEAKILTRDGALDLPKDITGIDYVLVADHRYPGRSKPLTASEVGRRLDRRKLTPTDVVDELVRAVAITVLRAPMPVIVAHPFSLLSKIGIDASEVTDEHLRTLAGACLVADASIEVNEKWRCPSPQVLSRLYELGVELVAGSNAHCAADIGQWAYLDSTVAALAATAAA